MPRLSTARLGIFSLGILVCVVLLANGQLLNAGELDGRWHGTWEDTKSGHHGPLKGTFCQIDDCHYHVRFTGRFMVAIPFRYSVTLNVVGREGDKVLLAGESRLPFFGVFTYTGEATPCEFVANFCSRRYQGRFVLHR